MNNRVKKITFIALMVAVAFVLAWMESLFPPLIAVPGVKLGLTNIVVLITLYRLSYKDALFINLLRIIIAGFTFGNPFSMLYSLAGGILSGLGMMLLHGFKCRMITVSIAGGLLHNLGQLLVAMFILDTPSLFYYLVVLWISGSLSGAVLGILGSLILNRINTDKLG